MKALWRSSVESRSDAISQAGNQRAAREKNKEYLDVWVDTIDCLVYVTVKYLSG